MLTSYLVANAVILPASNWFARRFGRKRFLLICVVVFTMASFFCGAAPSLAIILLARVLQGAGGGALQPLSQSILLESFPVQKRSMSMAAYGLGIVLAPVIGPTLGGWLTDTFSWRYAFYINIPVGILALILISRFVHDPPYIKNAKVGAFDNIGFGLLMVWTGCLQIVLDKGQEDDWFGAVWVRWAVAALVVSLLVGSGTHGPIPTAWSTCTSSRTATSAPAASWWPCWACASTSPSPSCRSTTRRFWVTRHLPPGWWSVRAALVPL